MDRRTFLASGLAVAGASLAGCTGFGARSSYDVGMLSADFVPQTTITVPNTAPAWVPRHVPTFEVSVGDPVVWENTGSREHTVTAATRKHARATTLLGAPDNSQPSPRIPPGGSFFASGGFPNEISAVKSFLKNINGGGVIPPGERYVHTFQQAGWYHYYCIPHEPAGMMGNVHVVSP